jgi:hypothetical protein
VIRAQQREHEVRREAPDFPTGSPTIYLSIPQWSGLYRVISDYQGDYAVGYSNTGERNILDRDIYCVHLTFPTASELTMFTLRYSEYVR